MPSVPIQPNVQNAMGSADAPTPDQAHGHCVSRLLLLPKELRLEIYRHVLVERTAPQYRDAIASPNTRVLIISKDHDLGDTSAPSSAIRYVCNRDLRILQTSQQLREEAGDVFYHAYVFTLYLYMPRDAKSQSILNEGCSSYVDLSRIRRCRISSTPWRYPRSKYDSKEESIIWKHFNQFAEALSRVPGHQMQDLLIECYHFEVAAVGEQSAFFSLEYMIEDLNVLRGIKHVHIRALNPELWPYLRDLERLMMSDETFESEMKDSDATSPGKLAVTQTQESPDSSVEELLRRLRVLPLYQNTAFVHSIGKMEISVDRDIDAMATTPRRP